MHIQMLTQDLMSFDNYLIIVFDGFDSFNNKIVGGHGVLWEDGIDLRDQIRHRIISIYD